MKRSILRLVYGKFKFMEILGGNLKIAENKKIL